MRSWLPPLALFVGFLSSAGADASEVEEPFEPLPQGLHECPPGTVPAKYSRRTYYEYLCLQGGRRYAREGPFLRFGLDGRLWVRGHHRLGQPFGAWSVYKADGMLSYEATFPGGFAHYLRCPDGTRPGGGLWGPNSRTYYRCVRSLRVADGPEMRVHPSTLRPIELAFIVNGRRDGPAFRWSYSGELQAVLTYQNGEIVEEHALR